jgi:hypothetical protein
MGLPQLGLRHIYSFRHQGLACIAYQLQQHVVSPEQFLLDGPHAHVCALQGLKQRILARPTLRASRARGLAVNFHQHAKSFVFDFYLCGQHGLTLPLH